MGNAVSSSRFWKWTCNTGQQSRCLRFCWIVFGYFSEFDQVWGCFCKTPCDTLPPGLILTAYQTKKPRSSSPCTFSPIRCENDASCWAVKAVQSASSSLCSSPLTGQNFKTENQEYSFYLSRQEKVHLCSWLNTRHAPTERDRKERNWGKIFCTFS